MLFDPARHETLDDVAWDPARAERAIARIVADAEARFAPETWWPVHPRDVEPGDAEGVSSTTLYFGAAGVIWALDRLGATTVPLDGLLEANREWLRANGHAGEHASYLMGDTPIELLAFSRAPSPERADRLAELIAGNREHPARELMWGAPGTMLTALHLHERTGDERWAELFEQTASILWAQLEWSPEHGCRFWTQDLYGRRCSYLDGVHGFVATAAPLIRGRELLGAAWPGWHEAILETVRRTAAREGAHVNWRTELDGGDDTLMQVCHGAPGFVVCLGEAPGDELDDLLLAAGETVWAAGPLRKGPGLCHGTAGNGYAFLKLHRRTGDDVWLQRARAFAMHAIGQSERDARVRHSLWTGDLGLAVYLRDCLDVRAAFPTLDVF